MPRAELNPVLRLLPRPMPLATPVLQLDEVGVGDACVSFSACGGETVHLSGGTAKTRLRVLTMAAGFVEGGSGRCAIQGQELLDLPESQRRCVRERFVARVLRGDTLGTDGAAATARLCVALPLLRRGTDAHEALTRATQELDALCAGGLAARRCATLDGAESRLVLLARAMVTRPPLLVLEHPEEGLPADAVAAVRAALWSLAADFETCVLMSSGHPRLVASADRHIDLDRCAARQRLLS